ncbi:hypothetical protein C8R44DRAFT_904404, partial [Mycena epipterygia]
NKSKARRLKSGTVLNYERFRFIAVQEGDIESSIFQHRHRVSDMFRHEREWKQSQRRQVVRGTWMKTGLNHGHQGVTVFRRKIIEIVLAIGEGEETRAEVGRSVRYCHGSEKVANFSRFPIPSFDEQMFQGGQVPKNTNESAERLSSKTSVVNTQEERLKKPRRESIGPREHRTFSTGAVRWTKNHPASRIDDEDEGDDEFQLLQSRNAATDGTEKIGDGVKVCRITQTNGAPTIAVRKEQVPEPTFINILTVATLEIHRE